MNENINEDEQKRYDELCFMALDFARHNNFEELQKMLEAKMPVNLQDTKGNSLLMLATYNGAYECAKLLIKHGASVDLKNDKGQTPLAGVCFKGNLDMVKLLVENGANIHENNGLGMTPLTFASMFGHLEIVRYLTCVDNSAKGQIYIMISKCLNAIKNIFSFLHTK